MKGPYERLKYDLRRVFECPRCHRRVKFAGSASSMLCDCVGTTPEDKSPAVMNLVEDGVRRIDGRTLPAKGSAVVPEVPAVVPEVPAVVPEVPAVVPEVPAVVPEVPAVVPEVPAVVPEVTEP